MRPFCGHCGRRGNPAPSRRRKVRGHRPYVELDMLITAIGQGPDIAFKEEDKQLAALDTTRWNTIEADEETLQSDVPHIFTGGDLWLGPAPARPYNKRYMPGNLTWNRWWDFGNGRIGDIGSHAVDLVFWALDLKYPLTVEGEGPGRPALERVPPWQKATWTFPARGNKPPVTVKWCHGNVRFDELKDLDLPNEWPIAIHFVGSEGRLTMQIERGPAGPMELYPKAKFANYTPPPRTLPRSPGGEYRQWIEAIRNNNPAAAEMPFSYSGPLSETLALGNVAYRVGKKLEWDPVLLKATNAPEADKFIQGSYRLGWELDKPKIPTKIPSDKTG